MKLSRNLFTVLLTTLFTALSLTSCGGGDEEGPSGMQDVYTMSTEIIDPGNLEEEGFLSNLQGNCLNWTTKTQKTFEQNAIALFSAGEGSYVDQVSGLLLQRYQDYKRNTMLEKIYFTARMTLKNSQGKVIRSQDWVSPDEEVVDNGVSYYSFSVVVTDPGNLEEEGFLENLQGNCDNWHSETSKGLSEEDAIKLYEVGSRSFVSQVSGLLDQLYAQYQSNVAEDVTVHFAVEIQLQRLSDNAIIKKTPISYPKAE